ncbi:hypothetical protein CAEBREN_21465 [Caenorhabditis brenneri]|uniref:Uncharacterized protein n=1 Tax=Caenorhabditis brenneri TaxID=135651 RepID=G0NHR8_CAEBE|nr:hypothetical protein CAEBREN_21465 [Caenorhabditis brenneri]
MMYLSATIINTVAISFPFISMIVYARLLLCIFCFKTIHKSSDLSLFYVKFMLDLVLSFISFIKLIMYALALTKLSDWFVVNRWLTYFVLWPINLMTATRGILLTFIAIDRIIATYLPIMFFKYRKFIPTVLIVGIILIYPFIDTYISFVVCQPNLKEPTECVNAMCVLGPCYQNYSLEFQQANRLAFIDAGIIVVFDLIPPIAHTLYPNFFDYVGAINSVAQTLGFVVEAYLTSINLQLKNHSKVVTSTGNIVVRSGDILDLSSSNYHRFNTFCFKSQKYPVPHRQTSINSSKSEASSPKSEINRHNISNFKTIKKTPELSLFYCKFVFDLVISVISFLKLVLYGLAMTSLVDYLQIHHWLTFFIVWPVDMMSQMRAVLLFFIALDRTFATYFPITFFKYRKLIPSLLIVFLVLLYSVADANVAFWYCHVDLNTPTDCISGKCILGSCYLNYWLAFQKVSYSFIIALTIILIVKLFIWNRYKKQHISRDLRRVSSPQKYIYCLQGFQANRLAVIDCGILMVFDFIPPFLNTAYPDFFNYVGAISSVSKTLGLVVESTVATINLQQKYQTMKGVNSTGNIMVRSGKADSSFVKLTVYALATMTSLIDFFLLNHWLTFLSLWPVNLFGSVRAILLFFIALDRTFATYLPIKFFKYRKLVPTFFIVGISLSYTVADTSIAFLYCKINLDTPTECVNGLCVLGACYQNYWLDFQQVLYSLIVCLTVLLVLKLFVWNRYKKQTVSRDLKRANRLALIDCTILIVFDLIPPILHTPFPNFFDYVGAINSVAQTLGFVVESILVTINLQQKYQTKTGNSTGNIVNKSGLMDTSGHH